MWSYSVEHVLATRSFWSLTIYKLEQQVKNFKFVRQNLEYTNK